jgi:bacillithiol system protein YtxJ
MVHWQEITSIDALHALLADSSRGHYVVLKHSGRCGISAMAKSRLERHADVRLSYFMIDVLRHRDVSNELARVTNITHESPQAFLYEGDRLLEVKSHMAISPSELSRRLNLIAQM